MTRSLTLPFDRCGVDELPALFQEPTGRRRASSVLLAHGAGYSMRSPFLSRLADELCARGFPVLRFDYPYRVRADQAGKRMARVDPVTDLEAAHELALDELLRLAPEARAILAGKSLGARIASRVAAKGARCAGLALFGYPLHPKGKPEKERSEHFPAVRVPSLFVQGTRDELCDLAQLQRALPLLAGPTRLVVIEGADHSFQVLRSSGRTFESVQDQLVNELDRWEVEALPAV